MNKCLNLVYIKVIGKKNDIGIPGNSLRKNIQGTDGGREIHQDHQYHMARTVSVKIGKRCHGTQG